MAWHLICETNDSRVTCKESSRYNDVPEIYFLLENIPEGVWFGSICNTQNNKILLTNEIRKNRTSID